MDSPHETFVSSAEKAVDLELSATVCNSLCKPWPETPQKCSFFACCDGSAPMCFMDGEFRPGGQDVRLGEIGGCPFYMGAAQFEYWSHTQLIIDVVPGRGASFSLEAPEGVRFLTRSRLFSDGEVEALRSDPGDMTKKA